MSNSTILYMIPCRLNAATVHHPKIKVGVFHWIYENFKLNKLAK